MKKLLLLSSMLFLGSCGNSDKTFDISTMILSGKTDGTSTLTVTFTSLPKVTYAALKVSGTYTSTVSGTAHECKFVDVGAVAVTTAIDAATSITFTGTGTSLKGVDQAHDSSCIDKNGTITKVSLAKEAMSISSDGTTYKNTAKADGTGSVVSA